VAASSKLPQVCWICGKMVSLESCMIDEHGLAVHEDCSVAKIAAKFGEISGWSPELVDLVRSPVHKPDRMAEARCASVRSPEARDQNPRKVSRLRNGSIAALSE
jgi:hypothetical protein